MYDVCIVGAGPAGSTLARMIGRRCRVLLVDQRPLNRPWAPGDRSKLCGALLAPRAQAELARQGLGVPREVMAGPQLFAVRAFDAETRLERLYQRFYISTDREAFDRWLVSLVPNRVETAFGWKASSIDNGGPFPLLRFETPGGGRASIESRLIVGADGAASMLRKAAGVHRRSPRVYRAVQSVFAAAWHEPHYGAVFDPRVTDFYGWTIPRGDTVVVGAAFPTGSGAAQGLDSLVDVLRSTGFGLGEELSRASAPLVRPTGPADVMLGSGRIALVGEAAGLVSPSSAEGISYALRSGAALGMALAPGIDGALGRYARAAQPLAAEVCWKVAKAAVIGGQVPRRLVMATGVGSIRGAVRAADVRPVPAA